MSTPLNTLPELFHRARRDPALAVLEGFHPAKHALRFSAEILRAVSPEPAAVLGLARELAPDMAGRLAELIEEVPGEAFARLAPRSPATGLLAIARRPAVSVAEVLALPGPAPVVLLEEPARLGNIGAAVRAAAAAGAAGLLTTGRHDPWHPEALRGGAGLQFAVPTSRVESLSELLATDLGGRPLAAIHPEGEPLASGSLPPRAVLAFGTERSGLSPGLLDRADLRFRIPMREGVSSLNLATAVAVALYLLGATQ